MTTSQTHYSFGNKTHKRVQLDCSSPKITDQSSKAMCDINNIMAQYAKTGLFTHLSKDVGQYIDNTLAIPLEQAHDMLMEAKDLFYQLPAQVRKLMQNDPTQLNEFISDPDNHPILIKYGLIELRTTPKTDEGVQTPSPAPARAKTQINDVKEVKTE